MFFLVAWVVCFSLAFVGNKYVLMYCTPMLYVAIRMGIPGIFLFVENFFIKRRNTIEKLSSNWFKFGLTIFLTTLFPLYLRSYGLKHLPASRFTILGSIDPFAACFWGWIIFGDIVTLRQIIASIIAMSGIIVLVITKDNSGILNTPSLWIFSYPELAALASTFVAKLGWALTKSLIKDNNLHSTEMNGVIMFFAGIAATIISYFNGEFVALSSFTNPKFFAFTVATIFINTLGYLFFTECLRRHHFTLISIAGCSISPLVTLISHFVYGDQIYFGLIISMIIIAFAVKLFTSEHRPKEGI